MGNGWNYERAQATIVALGYPLHPSKVSRQSTKQALQPEPDSESAHAPPHKGNTPVAERNLA
jgi:hypothetical protein